MVYFMVQDCMQNSPANYIYKESQAIQIQDTQTIIEQPLWSYLSRYEKVRIHIVHSVTHQEKSTTLFLATQRKKQSC